MRREIVTLEFSIACLHLNYLEVSKEGHGSTITISVIMKFEGRLLP